MISRRFVNFRCLVCLLVILASAMICNAESQILNPVTGTADDILTDYSFYSYDVFGSEVVGWANGSLKVLNKDGTVVSDLGTPTDYSGGWNSFTTIDPDGSSAWVGFTVSGNTDDRIYQVDLATGTWIHRATLAGNFDLDFYGITPYVSGLNSTDWSDPTCIWALDTSGSDAHDKIVEMTGNSAGLAFDSLGNAYYASYGSGATLYRWDAVDIASAIGAGYLTYSDGTKLSDLDTGAYDIDVDDVGNIIFNGNGGSNYLAMWDGTLGDGLNYDILADGLGYWFTMLDAEGDITSGGYFYQADYAYYGIAEVQIPEPATVVLLGLGGLLLRKQKA